MMRLPNADSMVVVMETMSPRSSTMEKWLVPDSASPGGASAMARSVISFARLSR
jgi:hypothetical protein